MRLYITRISLQNSFHQFDGCVDYGCDRTADAAGEKTIEMPSFVYGTEFATIFKIRLTLSFFDHSQRVAVETEIQRIQHSCRP